MSYTPPLVIPDTSSDNFKGFLRNELVKIAQQNVVTSAQILALQPLHTAPPKPRKGYVVYADGTDWNPGSGEGVYRYNGTIWNFLG